MLTCLYDVIGYALLGSICLCVYFHAIWLDPCLHMLTCLDQVLPCLCASFHTFTHVSMLICLDLCFHMLVCLDLYFMPSSMCLCAPCYACMPRSRLVCHAMCYCSPFVHFITFSCVLAFWFDSI